MSAGAKTGRFLASIVVLTEGNPFWDESISSFRVATEKRALITSKAVGRLGRAACARGFPRGRGKQRPGRARSPGHFGIGALVNGSGLLDRAEE